MKNILRVWRGVEAESKRLQDKNTEEMWRWVDVEEIPETGCMTSRVSNEPDKDLDESSTSLTSLAISLYLLCNLVL